MSEPSPTSTDLSQLTGCLSVNDEGSVAQQTNGEPTKLEDGEVGLLQVAGWVFVKIGTFYFSL